MGNQVRLKDADPFNDSRLQRNVEGLLLARRVAYGP
jgi:hypothetical protein